MKPQDIVRALCASEARFRLVRALYGAPGEAFHLRGLAARARVDPAQVHKLLPGFAQAGLCEVVPEVPHRKYRAALDHPLAAPLTEIFRGAAAGDDGEVVHVARAPVLRSLLWSGRARDTIPAAEAFRHYEDNWRFVQAAEMHAEERRLFERLKDRYGGGLVNG
ncbi:MAG: hypothetical protein IT514_00785 [Burkholderiales bacterium]|nr:hypothetical protein [Burkholderiales bacterium]